MRRFYQKENYDALAEKLHPPMESTDNLCTSPMSVDADHADVSFPSCLYAISSRISDPISGNLYSKRVSLTRGGGGPFNMLTPGVNSDTVPSPALSHSLLTYCLPPNLSVCASTRMVTRKESL